MGKAWKEAEKEVARFFKGLRRIRIMYSESICDVLHAYFSIEVKYGRQVPKYLDVDSPVRLLALNYENEGLPTPTWYYVVPSSHLRVRKDRLFVRNVILQSKAIKTAKFLKDAFDQAKKYDHTKKPLVCVKPKYKRGFVAIWEAI